MEVFSIGEMLFRTKSFPFYERDWRGWKKVFFKFVLIRAKNGHIHLHLIKKRHPTATSDIGNTFVSMYMVRNLAEGIHEYFPNPEKPHSKDWRLIYPANARAKRSDKATGN